MAAMEQVLTALLAGRVGHVPDGSRAGTRGISVLETIRQELRATGDTPLRAL